MESEGKSRRVFSLLVCFNVACVLIFLLNCTLANAQGVEPNFFYYYSGRKIALPVSLNKLALRFKEGITLQQQKAIVESETNLGLFFEREELSIFNLILLPLYEGLTEENVVQTINSLNNKSGVEFACPVFH